MQKSLGALLLGCMIFLAIGIVSVVGASVREAQLQPGEAPTVKGLGKARTAMFGASALLLIVIYLGNAWWKVDATFRQVFSMRMWSNRSWVEIQRFCSSSFQLGPGAQSPNLCDDRNAPSRATMH
jgi:hypothetical protein